jgi:hypothetical protein
MKPQTAPYILLGILFFILVFIVGVRYGQRVEKTNKKISAILSLTPKSPKPTMSEIKYKTYQNKDCAIEFLYPSVFKKEKQTTSSASFISDFISKNRQELSFSCAKEDPYVSTIKNAKIATNEAEFQQKNLSFQEFSKDKQNFVYFKITNPINQKFIYFLIDKESLPLLDSSLKFKAIK